MATTIQNLNSTHVTSAIDEEVNKNLTALEIILEPLLKNLSPDERRRYGSIGEQNKLLVNKTHDYATKQPAMRSPDVNWDEFLADFTDRSKLEGMIARLQRLIEGLNNAKTLHDFDNYHAALDDYAYTSYKAQTAAAGFETKLRDMKQFFIRTKPTAAPENPAEEVL